jgi:hypothetical protein
VKYSPDANGRGSQWSARWKHEKLAKGKAGKRKGDNAQVQPAASLMLTPPNQGCTFARYSSTPVAIVDVYTEPASAVPMGMVLSRLRALRLSLKVEI